MKPFRTKLKNIKNNEEFGFLFLAVIITQLSLISTLNKIKATVNFLKNIHQGFLKILKESLNDLIMNMMKVFGMEL